MGNFSVSKRKESFGYAWKGIKSFLRHEHNAWIHCSLAVLVIVFGLIFDLSAMEWIAAIGCIGLVLIMEAVNTAIEQIVNFISPEYNKMAGDIKDIAAGAVLISAVTAAIIGTIIFLPKFIYLFR